MILNRGQETSQTELHTRADGRASRVAYSQMPKRGQERRRRFTRHLHLDAQPADGREKPPPLPPSGELSATGQAIFVSIKTFAPCQRKGGPASKPKTEFGPLRGERRKREAAAKEVGVGRNFSRARDD